MDADDYRQNRLIRLTKELDESGRNRNFAELYLKVQDLISEQLNVILDEVTLNRHISNDLGADGCDTLILAMALEDEFDIEIPDHILGATWYSRGIKAAASPLACMVGELLDCIYDQVAV